MSEIRTRHINITDKSYTKRGCRQTVAKVHVKLQNNHWLIPLIVTRQESFMITSDSVNKLCLTTRRI